MRVRGIVLTRTWYLILEKKLFHSDNPNYMCTFKHYKLTVLEIVIGLFVKLYLSLLFLYLWERESWHYNHSVPHHRKLFKHLEMTYTQVWYIIGIVSSSPTHFHSEKIGLIRVTYDPPVSIRVNKYYSDLYSGVIHHWNRKLKPYWFPLRKNRVNLGHLWPPCQY